MGYIYQWPIFIHLLSSECTDRRAWVPILIHLHTDFDPLAFVNRAKSWSGIDLTEPRRRHELDTVAPTFNC